MSQFGADIFDDDSKPPVEPPTSGEPPKKRTRKPARKKAAAAAPDSGEPPSVTPTAPAPAAKAPVDRASAAASPASGQPVEGEQETPAPKKVRRKGASRRSGPADEPQVAGESTPAERVHDDLGDVLFPSRRRAAEAPPVARPQPLPSPRASEPPAEPKSPSEGKTPSEGESPFEPGEHEGGPTQAREDDDNRRGRRRGRRGRRGAQRDADPIPQDGANSPNDSDALPANAPVARPRRGDFAHPVEGDVDAREGGSLRPDETADAPPAVPSQDPFARRRDEPRHGNDRHRGDPRRDQGHRHGHPQRGHHGRDDRRDPRRDDWRRDRHTEDSADDLGPPAGLPRRDLATARRAPALPTPAASRRTVALVDVAGLMQQARDCGGELSFRRLRKALLGHDELVLGLAFVTPDVPPSGRGALLASGFALRECTDADAAATALVAALEDVPTDAERIVLAGSGAETGAANGGSTQRAGFRTVADRDRGDLLLGPECMFVP